MNNEMITAINSDLNSLYHSGRLGMKKGVFGASGATRWQSQAVYAKGMSNPNAEDNENVFKKGLKREISIARSDVAKGASDVVNKYRGQKNAAKEAYKEAKRSGNSNDIAAAKSKLAESKSLLNASKRGYSNAALATSSNRYVGDHRYRTGISNYDKVGLSLNVKKGLRDLNPKNTIPTDIMHDPLGLKRIGVVKTGEKYRNAYNEAYNAYMKGISKALGYNVTGNKVFKARYNSENEWDRW